MAGLRLAWWRRRQGGSRAGEAWWGVVGVYAVGVALAALLVLPSIYGVRCRTPSYEASAVWTLRNILSTQAAWRQNDMDGNGRPDYWTADVFGLYACADESGKATKYVDVAVAKSDRGPHSMQAMKKSRPYYAVTPPAAPVSKSGYLIEAIRLDETGRPYARDENGDGAALENDSKFAFIAVPEVYGSTGVNVFIVNEEGVIYGRDFGRTPAPGEVAWPGKDPTAASPPWRVVQ